MTRQSINSQEGEENFSADPMALISTVKLGDAYFEKKAMTWR